MNSVYSMRDMLQQCTGQRAAKWSAVSSFSLYCLICKGKDEEYIYKNKEKTKTNPLKNFPLKIMNFLSGRSNEGGGYHISHWKKADKQELQMFEKQPILSIILYNLEREKENKYFY